MGRWLWVGLLAVGCGGSAEDEEPMSLEEACETLCTRAPMGCVYPPYEQCMDSCRQQGAGECGVEFHAAQACRASDPAGTYCSTYPAACDEELNALMACSYVH